MTEHNTVHVNTPFAGRFAVVASVGTNVPALTALGRGLAAAILIIAAARFLGSRYRAGRS